MRRLAEKLEFKTMEIATALEQLKNAKAAGFTHARISVAKYVQTAKEKERQRQEAEIEKGAQPGRIRPNGTPGKVRTFQ